MKPLFTPHNLSLTNKPRGTVGNHALLLALPAATSVPHSAS